MSGRFRSHMLIILATLILALLLGPPLAFASKLPTVCNVFHKRPVYKGGPCGHRAMLSKIQDKSFEVEAVHFANISLASKYFTPTPSICPTCFLEIADLLQSNPLRC